MDTQPNIPQQQVLSQSVELPRPEGSSDPEKQLVGKKPDTKKKSCIPKFGLPEDYPEDDLFL